MSKSIKIITIPYNGNNLEFLKELKLKVNCDGCLFRASESEELLNTLKFGTDRGGYPPSKWEDTDIPYEDVIFATTEQDIIDAEFDKKRSSSFKKFSIIENPVLLLYNIKGFEKIADRQWRFLDPNNKKAYLHTIINVSK